MKETEVETKECACNDREIVERIDTVDVGSEMGC